MEECGARDEALRGAESADGGVGRARVDGRPSRQSGGGSAAGGSGGHGPAVVVLVGCGWINRPAQGASILHTCWYTS